MITYKTGGMVALSREALDDVRSSSSLGRVVREGVLDYLVGPRYGPPTPQVYGPPEPEFCACEHCLGHPWGNAPESW